MSNLDIVQIVDKLMGNIEWAGETNADNKALENLQEADLLVEHLVNQLTSNIEVLNSHPTNHSAQELATKSKDILGYVKSEIERIEL